jgi:hypothetical protein
MNITQRAIKNPDMPEFFSSFRVLKGHFNLGKAVDKIRLEILAGENGILDTEFLAPKDAVALHRAVEAEG